MIARDQRWRLALAAASLLLIGGVLGVTFDRLHHRGGHVVVHRVAPGADASFALLDSVLALRPEQRARVREVLATRQPAIDSVWRYTHGSLRGILDSTIGDLERVLDAEQAARLRAFSSDLRTNPPAGAAFRH